MEASPILTIKGSALVMTFNSVASTEIQLVTFLCQKQAPCLLVMICIVPFAVIVLMSYLMK